MQFTGFSKASILVTLASTAIAAIQIGNYLRATIPNIWNSLNKSFSNSASWLDELEERLL
jgi:hypothetical protein